MKNKHPNIKFTSKFKKNDCFPFSDVKVRRSKKQLVTLVFLKEYLVVFYKL